MRAFGLMLGVPAVAAVVATVVIACSSDSKATAIDAEGGAPTAGVTADGGTVTTAAVFQAYAASLYQAYSDAVTDQQAFDAQLQAFVASPTEATLATARTGWLASRAHYMLTEGARFVDGPIDVDPPNHEADMNSWPLDENYIDYVTNAGVVDETQGFVNHPDLMPTIDVTAIDAANARGGDDNISDGYHAEEFLLWGQALLPVGPGQRPATDYVIGGVRKNPDRRQTYLKVASQGILQHLTAVRDAWAPNADYRTKFIANQLPTPSIALILTGLGRFSKGELSNERISAPYESKSRRDQHDCFSSNTLTDYTRDAEGIQMMYLGTYGGATGPGIADLVRAANPTLETQIETQIQKSIDLMKAIPPPFEQAIVGDDTAPSRIAIKAVIDSLATQGDLFAQAAGALGQTIEVPADND